MKELLSKERIQKRITELGTKISKDYAGMEITMIGILKGSFPFLSDLIRNIDLKMQIEFIQVSSYGNKTTSSGVINIIKDLTRSIDGENILIVEDIIDSGLTLQAITKHIKLKKPKSIATASLLIKPEKMIQSSEVKYSGFEIADHFVVGMGMDYKGYYRNLDHIAIISDAQI